VRRAAGFTASFLAALDPFREALRIARFARFAFKRRDFALADDRLEAFLVAFDFTFAFVATDAATYTG
jgi:hypothetical protein